MMFGSCPQSAAQADDQFQCVTQVGGKPTPLPHARLNDDYCDCLDGSDETQTAACSGMTTTTTFSCRLNVNIPLSRVNDGICDCCDGADEALQQQQLDCPDDCTAMEERLAAEQQLLLDQYQKGSAVRAQQLEEFKVFLDTTQQERAAEADTLQQLQSRLEERETAFASFKQRYSQLYLQRHAALYHSNSLLNGLTEPELEQLIGHVCQVQGELSFVDSKSSSKTCVPLRLAGVDLGLLWDQTYHLVDHASLPDVLYHNARHKQENVWKLPERTATKRRLTVLVAAEDDYPDDYEEYPYDDDYHYDEEEDVHNHDTRRSDNSNNESDGESDVPAGDKRDELTAVIKALPFSANRVAFVDHASELIAVLEEALKEEEEEESDDQDEDKTGEEDNGERTKSEEEKEAEPELTFTSLDPKDLERAARKKALETMDPMLPPMLKSTLEKRRNSIEKGFDYAVSSKVLLEHAPKSSLRELAIGTIYRSSISAVSLYQILVNVVPQLANPVSNDPRTCTGPFAEICPPQTIQRNGASFPLASIVSSVESFCTNQTPTEGSCASGDSDQPLIPTEIPDGYINYYEPQPRTESDALSELFATFSQVEEQESKVQEEAESADKEIVKLRGDVSRSEKQLKKLDESLGSDDPNKYGPDGELHALKDQCFEVPEGKYIYEICLFGSAYQKDKGESSGRGTNLGTWQGASTEMVTDDQGRHYPQRVWKWDKGTKCWNGPQRSATVHVTCGAETKAIGADEPDTCRYVLELQSPVACDEEFRIRHNLP